MADGRRAGVHRASVGENDHIFGTLKRHMMVRRVIMLDQLADLRRFSGLLDRF